jgi:hypothetical protein
MLGQMNADYLPAHCSRAGIVYAWRHRMELTPLFTKSITTTIRQLSK